MPKANISVKYSCAGLYLLLLAISIGCTTRKLASSEVGSAKIITSTDTIFKYAYNAESTVLLDLNTLTNDIEIFDSLLVVSGVEGERIVSIISISRKTTIDSLIERGDEDRRLTHVTDILRLPEEKGAWVYDVTMQKFLHINLVNVLKGDTAIDDYFTLSKRIIGTIHPIAVKNGVFAATTFARSDLRFFKFDRNSKILREIGELPRGLTDIPDAKEGQLLDFEAIALESCIAKQPYFERYAIASKVLGLLEFYYGDTLYRSIRGPQATPPIVKIGHPRSGPVPVFTKDTKFKYLQIKSTKNFLAALYSGHENFQTWGNTIFVYDWVTGLPKMRIVLDTYASAFCLVEADGIFTIYFLEHNTGKIRYCMVDIA